MESTTTTTARCPRNKRSSKSGYTIAEIMVAATVATLLLAGVLSSWGFVGRSSVGMANYTEMNTIGRIGLETFARDVRQARDIYEDFNDSEMVLILEEDEDGNRSLVNYYYDPTAQAFKRQTGSRAANASNEVWGNPQTVFKDVEDLKLSFFQTTGEPAINSLETRLIQLELQMVREARTQEHTKRIVSARYIMRNKLHGL